MKFRATALKATAARNESVTHDVAWTWSSPTTSVTVRVQKTAMTTGGLPWENTPERVTERMGSLTVESSRGLEWNSAIAGGLRFRYSTSPGVFLVGYGMQRRF